MKEASLLTLDLLDKLEELFLDGSRVPFSGGRIVDEQEAIDVLDAIRESIPQEIPLAQEIVDQGRVYIEKAQRHSEELMQAATRKKEQMLNHKSIRQEAENKVLEIQNNAKIQSDKLVLAARQQSALIESEMKSSFSELEKKYSQRRQQLEQEYLDRRQLLENEITEIRLKASEEHDINCKSALNELEKLREESIKLRVDANSEAERIHYEAIQFRNQTQKQCEVLIQKNRNEADSIQDGANRYAIKALNELEQRLSEMTNEVIAGRRELSKIQSINNSDRNKTKINDNSNLINFNPARRQVTRLAKSIKSIG